MRIIISPAKKMREDTDSLPWRELPPLLEKTELLLDRLRELSYPQLKALWRCSDAIAERNVQRLRTMDLRKGLTPALLAYEGIQYQYMAPGVFTGEELDYVQEHLRILSGFYGILRPFDGVTPYRLEMQAKLPADGAEDLYTFWGGSIAAELFSGADWVLDLASREYSRSAAPYAPAGVPVIACRFCERSGEKLAEKGTLCKMARGTMVRLLAENRVEDPERVKTLSPLDFHFAPEESGDTLYTFIKEER